MVDGVTGQQLQALLEKPLLHAARDRGAGEIGDAAAKK